MQDGVLYFVQVYWTWQYQLSSMVSHCPGLLKVAIYLVIIWSPNLQLVSKDRKAQYCEVNGLFGVSQTHKPDRL